MNSHDDVQTDRVQPNLGLSQPDESQIQLKTGQEHKEYDVFVDSAYKQRAKLVVTSESVELAQGGRARTVFSLDYFMGIQVYAAKDVEKPSVKNQSPSLVLLQARIHKKLVVVDRFVFYSPDSDLLMKLREEGLQAYYRKVDPNRQSSGSPKRKLLFFVSPKSGKGTGLKIYDQQKEYFE